MSKKIFDVIIIGSGPAGLTAALYTSRANLDTLVLAGYSRGGQLSETTLVENFPGFPDGVLGPEFMVRLEQQALKFGTNITEESCSRISGNYQIGFEVETSVNKYYCKSIIIATGASAKWLGLESEQRLKGKGVSACATCDGFFFKDKIIAVVGGGDAAMEESTFLTKFVSKVYVLVRGSQEAMRASKYMQERALTNPKVHFIFNTEVTEVLGDNFVTGLKVKNSLTNEISILNDIQGLFVAIGHSPNTDFLNGFIELGKFGYITVHDNVKTSVEGVFAAGDAADYKYRQAITAAGMGCIAALETERFLAETTKI